MDVIEVIDGEAGRRALAAGMLACPSCGGTLRPWGRARVRTVRDGEGVQAIHPDRARCAACRATHVVLPAFAGASRLAQALEALAAALAVVRRFGGDQGDLWPVIAVVTRGMLLAPSPAT
jgi:hypothetical protein